MKKQYYLNRKDDLPPPPGCWRSFFYFIGFVIGLSAITFFCNSCGLHPEHDHNSIHLGPHKYAEYDSLLLPNGNIEYRFQCRKYACYKLSTFTIHKQ